MAERSLSLSELLGRIGKILKEGFPGSYWIMAEILELHVNQRGHCYMELIEKNRDHDAILARARATIWASKYSMLRPYFETTTDMQLKSGIKILCKGTIEFHAQYGLSINITDIDPVYTLGDLARKKLEVIRKLREEGVIDMNRELPFPSVPQRIAVISSETAAGYGDFMESMSSNSQGYYLYTRLYPAVMQGDDAPASITGALDSVFTDLDNFDCVVIIRGGGSKADLECFNNYDLAYHITQFPIPVITGIGHERDESVADMVASQGLKTPTAVAEFLVDRLMAFEFKLSAYRDTLSAQVNRTVLQQGSLLERFTVGLSHITRRYLQKKEDWLHQSTLAIQKGTGVYLSRKKDHISLLETRNGLVNPENVLRRGYSMTLHHGKAITSTKGIGPGDTLDTRLHRGSVISKVEKTTRNHGKGKN
jgi:exodeoxyribonuclease VII large subunit